MLFYGLLASDKIIGAPFIINSYPLDILKITHFIFVFTLDIYIYIYIYIYFPYPQTMMDTKYIYIFVYDG